MIKYKVDICCTQELKIKEGIDINISKYRLIALPTESRHYGNGFIVSKKLVNNIHRYWRVSDRIAVIQFHTSENLRPKNKYNVKSISDTKIQISHKTTKPKKLITIINVYAPQSGRLKISSDELDEMYNQLNTLVSEHNKNKDTSLLLICGDFNAKVGKNNDGTECLGQYSRGRRNVSGQCLIDFCNAHNFFVTNSAFKHKAAHITTWQSTRKNKNTNKVTNIFNQIDYIICPDDQKCNLRNARSYNGISTRSDHRLVITNMKVSQYNIYLQQNKKKEAISNRIDYNKLVNDQRVKEQYQQKLRENLELCNKESWKDVSQTIIKTAENTVGFVKRNQKNSKSDHEIEALSEEQKKLKLKIDQCQDHNKICEMKTQRNNIMHQIQNKIHENQEKEIDKVITEIEETKDNTKMYKAIKLLNRKPYENPYINDEEGKRITNEQDMYEAIRNHFQQHFFDPTAENIEPFEGNPKTLNRPITQEEIRCSINKMRNNRAPGFDNITIELIKYGTEDLVYIICDILNNIFEKHNEEAEIGKGVLITLPKPKKIKGPLKHLRPIILLIILRKILSDITLNRIKPSTEKYLSQSQSAYRSGRSTTDIVWMYRWLTAKTFTSGVPIFVTGIDMTAAFDTIKRGRLLEIFKTIVGEDELRMIRVLLSNTTLEIKINSNDVVSVPFISNTGSAQGDGLSGKLFTIYFEASLRKLREEIDTNEIQTEHNYSTKYHPIIPEEAIYADDADFINLNKTRDNKINITAGPILRQDNLKVNDDKTEHTTITRTERQQESWRNVKKLGSLLGDNEDIINRKNLATNASTKIDKIWIRNTRISLEKRLNLYNSIVKSVLLYNSETWGLTKTATKNLNSFHRKQLRIILNIRHPHHISNKAIYEICRAEPISLEIVTRRWRFFGHALRLDLKSPAAKAMKFYFSKVEGGKKFRGPHRTTIVTTLNNDIQSLINTNNYIIEKYDIKKLITIDNLENLRQLAFQREAWKQLTKEMYQVARAEGSIHWN